MCSTRIDVIGQTHLRDSSQSLEMGMINYVIDQVKGKIDKTVNRVIDNFSLAHFDAKVIYQDFIPLDKSLYLLICIIFVCGR